MIVFFYEAMERSYAMQRGPFSFPEKGASGGWAKPYLSRPKLSLLGFEAPSKGALISIRSNRLGNRHPIKGAIYLDI